MELGNVAVPWRCSPGHCCQQALLAASSRRASGRARRCRLGLGFRVWGCDVAAAGLLPNFSNSTPFCKAVVHGSSLFVAEVAFIGTSTTAHWHWHGMCIFSKCHVQCTGCVTSFFVRGSDLMFCMHVDTDLRGMYGAARSLKSSARRTNPSMRMSALKLSIERATKLCPKSSRRSRRQQSCSDLPWGAVIC